jgi:Transposase IS116/IS110/IS902 family
MTGRLIGIRHRVKQTSEGVARPTQVALLDGDNPVLLDLKDEEVELAFVREGLQEGDRIAMILGGSGDYLAFALDRQMRPRGGRVFRIPAFTLGKELPGRDKERDALTLAELLGRRPELFYPVTDRDAQLILVREALVARTDAMKARIACEQRLYQRLIGKVFCGPEGLFPEGSIERWYDAQKASDAILAALQAEEKERVRDLVSALGKLDIYRRLFIPIQGCGPMIAARIIAAVIDIRRFERPSQLAAYLGVHVLPDGRLPRRRSGEVANWHGEGRQALYLLADQFNRRPDSFWGQKLREHKRNLRLKHPEVEVVEGKKRYSDGHIHKMAIWRTLTRFSEWLWQEWTRLEAEASGQKKAA